jgi:exopolysaccharide biosynthesis polyprenyl glycosylphosphotransferase
MLGSITDQRLFTALLSLERKRSERTGGAFILGLIEMPQLASADVRSVCDALRCEIRETDLIGWYDHPAVIGIIFSGLNTALPETIHSKVRGKIEQVLTAVLSPVKRERVTVTMHCFPEDFNEKLYPDLKTTEKHRSLYSVAKRVVDIAGSLSALVLFSPLLLIIPILVKLSSSGPVLFKQRRLGQWGKEFRCLKFRTMYVDNNPEIHQNYIRDLVENRTDSNGVYKIVNDPRVTPIGRVLRKTSLDELPQFLNVLIGDMSLVGPRPPIPYEVEVYKSWHKRRVIEVKPGITGLWQIEGRSRTTFDEMVRLDLRYVRQQSLWLDLKILFKTPRALVTGHGAY